MVAGKVRAAMGFQKSPSLHPKPTKSDHHDQNQPPPLPPSPASSGKSLHPNNNNTTSNKASSTTVFSRSFGVYFPARSSAQVQPRPPDASDLLRLVEDLRESEHRLKTELLEFKLLKESVAIVPVLEKQISSKTADLEDALKRIQSLEAENEKLRNTLDVERKESENKINELEAEVVELKKMASDRESEDSFLSSSQRFQGLMEASTARSSLIKNYLNSTKKGVCNSNKSCMEVNTAVNATGEEKKAEDILERPRHSRCKSEELVTDSLTLTHHHIIRSRTPRVPRPPPPKRSSSSNSSSPTCSAGSDHAVLVAPPPPPPPPPPKAPPTPMKKAAPPPPPPPPPKGLRAGAAKVRRVPEVVEFYHSLMRRDSRRDSGGNAAEAVPATANARDMIGEIENRSSHLLAIKTDVETQGDFIRFLIKEVEEAAFTDIEDVVPFVKWLDDELSYLVDERAVLKHFDWPEQRADALREAAFGYCDLKKLESEASSFRDDAHQHCGPALKKMQALLEKLEHGVYNLSRLKESATNRYKGFQIPMDWMLETGIVNQIKLASVKLAMKYMKRVSAELEAVSGGPEEEELIVQGVRFAFRVHQFAGGFDAETMRAFQELRDKARSCHEQCQNQQQRKLICKSSTAC